MPRYQPDRPVVLGLAGESCTGKTTLAGSLAPAVRVVLKSDELGDLWWEHLAIIAPLHEIVSILTKTEGDRRDDRVAYAIHAVLADILDPLNGTVGYEDLVMLVKELAATELDPEGKPRAFMQLLGDRLRGLDPDCLTRSVVRKMRVAEAQFNTEHGEDEHPPLLGFVISDVRFETEAAVIRNQPNGLLVKLWAPVEVRQDRAEALGHAPGIPGHAAEAWAAAAPDDVFDAIYDTSALSVADLRSTVHQLVAEFVTEE